MTTLTPAQKRALLWLPLNGVWRSLQAKFSIRTMSELVQFGFADGEHGPFGRQGGMTTRWRLTPAGIAARKAIEGEAQT